MRNEWEHVSNKARLIRRMGLWCVLVAALSGVVTAEPLHVQIDKLIEARADVPAAQLTSDSEFLRRISLDLAGRIPSAEEARTFLADNSPGKRQTLIDTLLNGPDYSRRMRDLFSVMLMERRGIHPEWNKFLQSSFQANKPWDQIVREILGPDKENETTRGSALFYSKRLEKYGQNPVDYPGLVRDIGRLFMGMDLQCAQCHDHPHIDDYKQHDYQGLLAFVGQTFIERGTDFPAVGDKPLKMKIEFTSVFTAKKGETGPRVPGGMEVELASLIKVLAKGESPASKQPAGKRNTKKQADAEKQYISKLKVIAEQLPRVENSAFTRNIVNRLWFVMMGRGLVHPLDLHHSKNPASHPKLLDLLAQQFAAQKFDVKWLLRELALTKTYQRSSLLPDGVERIPPESFRVAIQRPLSAEQLLWSMLQSSGELQRVLSVNDKKATDETNITANDDAAEAGLDGLTALFVAAFGNAPKDPEVSFSPTLKAALFVLNDDVVLQWLNPRDGNLIDRLSKLEEPQQIAEQLYLSILSRMPSDDERAEVADYLAKHSQNRTKAVGQLAWALLASTEFCINH